MSAQQARSAVAADHRSIIPGIPGLPWWAAVVVAATGCAAGFVFDAGSGKELTVVFSVLYAAGCVTAVLAVRQSGIFTAVIQPPLVLFCAVPGSYWLLHGAKYTGLKDLAINCGYPLIERFPLMLLTSAGVLVIGLLRWYLGIAVRSRAIAAADATPAAPASATDAARDAGRPGLAARLMSLVNRDPTHDDPADKPVKSRPRREHAVERSARATSAERRGTARRPAASRERRPRPPLDARPSLEDGPDLARERGQRRRPTRTREADAPEPSRREWLPRDPDLRGRPPRDIRRDPHARGARPTSRGSRFDPYEPVEPVEPAPPRGSRPNGATGVTGSHHPISRVRYRTSNGAEDHNEPSSEPRWPRKTAADSWE